MFIKYLEKKSIKLSRLIFYLLIFSLPIQTNKTIFTELSFAGNYHIFYNTIALYLTDILFYVLIISWLVECFLNSQSIQSFLRDLYTRIAQDVIYKIILTFWLILAISLIISRENLDISLFGLLKITQFILFFAYLREKINVSRETPTQSPLYQGRETEGVFWLILASSWVQSIIAIYQYIFQKSLGLSILGEEFLRPGLSGVAEFFSREIINPLFYNFFPYLSPVSEEISANIRAYGTFPHPNVLAGFLFIALIINLYLISRETSTQSPPYSNKDKPPLHLPLTKGEKQRGSQGGEIEGVNYCETHSPIEKKRGGVVILLIFSLILVSTGLVVTFSRFIWLISAVSIVIWLILSIFRNVSRETYSVKPHLPYETKSADKLNHNLSRERYLKIILSALLFGFLFNWFFFSEAITDRVSVIRPEKYVAQYYNADESFSQRYLFNEIALEMIKAKPSTGVGLRNFVAEMDNFSPQKLLPFQHQPAHNIYLLIAAESGVFALAVFLIFIGTLILRRIRVGRLKGADYALLVMLFGFLAIGMVDHYLWTIQQGQMMLWLVLGLTSAVTREYA